MEEAVWQLMIESFPYEERRSRDDQQKVMNHPDYRFQVLRNVSEEILGFISYWLFPRFLFVEHFAIASLFRNKGLGAQLFKEHCLAQYTGKQIVLEVERPDSELAQRRIGFYERLGFKMNPFTYMQPSYHTEGEEVPLLLMSYPTALDYKSFREVRARLYKDVYGVMGVKCENTNVK
ncbi:MAG: GNAT family N-acetyltransferase [Marinilabiliaceae bacterium]|nr:GNAT family N-acetyltransferase [Marinilabiliaceae bacterium]